MSSPASRPPYRALDATIAQNERRKPRRLTLPVLAIGGAEGIGEGAATTMKLAADDVRSVVIPGSGHYCLEEAPEEAAAALTGFLAPDRDDPAAAPAPGAQVGDLDGGVRVQLGADRDQEITELEQARLRRLPLVVKAGGYQAGRESRE
jgi:hypothetical protein